jgi:hypothetical protein
VTWHVLPANAPKPAHAISFCLHLARANYAYRQKKPRLLTGAFRRSRAPRSSQGEEHERHDKGSRPRVPPAARKCGHNTPDEQRGEGTQQPVKVEGWGRAKQIAIRQPVKPIPDEIPD